MVQFSHHRTRYPLRIMIEHRHEEPALVVKRRIEAATIDAGRFDQILNRGGLVAIAPKHLHRAVENFISVELFYASHQSQIALEGVLIISAVPAIVQVLCSKVGATRALICTPSNRSFCVD